MAGRAEESDDRTQPGVFLDAFMIAALRQHLAVLEPSAKPRPRRYSNSNVTFQIYTHRSTGQERAAAELIGHLIKGAINGSEGTAPEAS